MLKLALLTLCVTACYDQDRLLDHDEMADRFADATCARVHECAGIPVVDCDADVHVLMDSFARVGVELTATDADMERCESWVATAKCWTGSNRGTNPGPWRSPYCDFGQ